jgi:ketosteroid isomerase-like protein
MKQNRILKLAYLQIAVFSICTICNAQVETTSQVPEAKEAIAKTNLIYFDLYAKNDGSILRLYTKDACLMPPNAPAICGWEALAKDFKDTYAAGTVKGGKFISTGVYGDGLKYVTEEGLWQIFDANGQTIDEGKYLKLWEKTNEGWKIVRDSFNSNRASK